jgi:hypothetical protein
MDLVTGTILLLAQQSADVGGRGDNPDAGTGVLTIVIIAALVLVAGLVLVQVFRRGRVRRESQVPRPDRSGRVGRTGEFRES